MRFRPPFARHVVSLGLLVLTGVIVAGWWNSSRFSERRVYHLGPVSMEVFSASSLVRTSFARGRIGYPGAKTFYRHRNARGRMMARPLVPEISAGTGLVNVTFGYWHAAALSALATAAAYGVEWTRARRGLGDE